MANNIYGSTDISGAIGAEPTSVRSILIVGEQKPFDENEIIEQVSEVVFQIGSTTDARNKFGSLSVVPNMVKYMIKNGTDNIKGITIGTYGAGKTYASKAEAYAAAFAKTLDDKSIMFVQLDTNDGSLTTSITTHLDACESEDLFRYHMTSLGTGQSNAMYSSISEVINNSRVFMCGPCPVDQSNIALDGIYLASAVVAACVREATADPSLPMNSVKINGFGGLERILLNSDKSTLASAGVSCMDCNKGIISINRLVTTKVKDAEGNADRTWQEGTTRFSADFVLNMVEERLRANYPRTKNVARLLKPIRTDVIDVLTTMNEREIIQNFDPDTVSVIKDPNDIYGALIDYEYTVVTPLYNITITQHAKI